MPTTFLMNAPPPQTIKMLSQVIGHTNFSGLDIPYRQETKNMSVNGAVTRNSNQNSSVCSRVI